MNVFKKCKLCQKSRLKCLLITENSLTNPSDYSKQAKIRFTHFLLEHSHRSSYIPSCCINDTVLFPNLGLRNILPITTAKVPIVKFFHLRSGLEVDISLYNTLVRFSLGFFLRKI